MRQEMSFIAENYLDVIFLSSMIIAYWIPREGNNFLLYKALIKVI